jgi:tripartite-type tricarboxylate transporter receptor subunit TctC
MARACFAPFALAAALTATAVPALTHAADGGRYPTKPVRMIIPFAAGGATDVVVRIVANRLPDTLGQQDRLPGDRRRLHAARDRNASRDRSASL